MGRPFVTPAQAGAYTRHYTKNECQNLCNNFQNQRVWAPAFAGVTV